MTLILNFTTGEIEILNKSEIPELEDDQDTFINLNGDLCKIIGPCDE